LKPTDSKKIEDYIVVFEYTEAAKGYEGIRTWTPYPSKAEFDAEFAERGKLEGTEKIFGEQRVVAEGVSEKDAVSCVQKTPLRSYLKAAIEEATGSDGEIDYDVAKMRMQSVLIARGLF
jgi:hypothetical protein